MLVQTNVGTVDLMSIYTELANLRTEVNRLRAELYDYAKPQPVKGYSFPNNVAYEPTIEGGAVPPGQEWWKDPNLTFGGGDGISTPHNPEFCGPNPDHAHPYPGGDYPASCDRIGGCLKELGPNYACKCDAPAPGEAGPGRDDPGSRYHGDNFSGANYPWG